MCKYCVSIKQLTLTFTSIVAVHGLNGHAFGTWACHDEDQADLETMWLRDFLPAQIKGARVLIYGYNSALLGPNTSVSTIRDFAFDLLRRILADREFRKVCRFMVSGVGLSLV